MYEKYNFTYLPWHCLYFFPLQHGHVSFRPIHTNSVFFSLFAWIIRIPSISFVPSYSFSLIFEMKFVVHLSNVASPDSAYFDKSVSSRFTPSIPSRGFAVRSHFVTLSPIVSMSVTNLSYAFSLYITSGFFWAYHSNATSSRRCAMLSICTIQSSSIAASVSRLSNSVNSSSVPVFLSISIFPERSENARSVTCEKFSSPWKSSVESPSDSPKVLSPSITCVRLSRETSVSSPCAIETIRDTSVSSISRISLWISDHSRILCLRA